MKRRTLDIFFSGGAMVLAALLVVLGMVMSSNASFAKNYVHDQLVAQHITFKTADTLTAEEAKSACLVKYAGQEMTTGKQAECYANDFIGLHVTTVKGVEGKSYAQIGDMQAPLRTQIADATKAGDTAKAADLQKQLDALTTARETVFKGETLRGLLLTSFGFSEMGAKADQVMIVAYAVAGLLALLSLLGFAHALRTPEDVPFAAVERKTGTVGKAVTA